MTLDVTWDGVVLAKGAEAREQDGGWFIELEQPMPVGTRLELSGETQALVQGTRGHEGIGAGMIVKTVESRELKVESQKPEADEPAKADEAGKPEEGGKPDEGGGKNRRKKGRKG